MIPHKVYLIALSLFLFIFVGHPLTSQVKISGFIRDAQSGEALPGANIVASPQGTGSTTNSYGFFSFILPAGTHQLQISFIGYTPVLETISLTTDTVIQYHLTPGYTISEATITAKRKDDFITNSNSGHLQLSKASLNMPTVLLGEPDLMKVLQSLPGIAQGKEGSSEIYVRGGSGDQNLVLLDGAPVYNLNHAFGMLSLFNSDAIQHVNVQKGGIEARYGGRLSSVVDINVREGNDKTYKGSYGMSLLGSSLMFEGPVKKNKSSFFVSARRSWADLLLSKLASPGGGITPGINFYDVNTKVNFKFTNHNQLFFSIYSGGDKLFVRAHTEGHESKFSFGWGNHLASARWNHLIGKSMFAQMQVHASAYYDNEKFSNHSTASNDYSTRTSRFNELGLKYNIDWQPAPLHRLSAGFEQQYRNFKPALVEQQMNGTYAQTQGEEINLWGTALYVDHKWQPGNWQINPGVRLQFTGNEAWWHLGVEPRLMVAYSASPKTTIKASAMITNQPIHAIRKSTMGWPGYFYVPSTKNIKPQTAWQVSSGLLSAATPKLKLDLDIWIKQFNHLLASYNAPTTAFASSNWEQVVSAGQGRAAGFDFLAEYTAEKFNARLAYTLSKAQSQYNDYHEGNWFDFDYDRRHDLSLTSSFVLQERKKISRSLTTTFSYRTGTPFMMPTWQTVGNFPYPGSAAFDYDYSTLDYYPGPNNVRMPDYHRLDVSYQSTLKKKHGSRTWNLGIYNVYNQQNPYLYYNDSKKGFQQLVMFPIMPFVSFKRVF
jgi:hypothetical protein